MASRASGSWPWPEVRWAAACALLGAVAVARAQDAGPQRLVSVVPYATVQHTLTDHHRLDVGGEADAITSVTAGVGLAAQSSRQLRARLDYRLTQRVYIRHREDDLLDHSLSARMDGRWLEGRLGLVAGASVARQSVSLFGANPGNSDLASTGASRTANLRLQPSYNGLIHPDLAFTAAGAWVENQVQGQSLGDFRSITGNFGLRPNRLARFTALADAEHSDVRYSGGRRVQSDRVFGSLQADLNEYDLRLGVNAGHELSNVLTMERLRYTTYGVQGTWAPSPRTRVDAAYNHRAYGASHQVQLSYRTARTIWSASSARDLTVGTGQDLRVLPGDNAFAQLFPYLRSVLGDVAAAELLVSRSGSIDLTQRLPASLLAGSSTLRNQQQLSAVWTGPRNTATLVLSRSLLQRVDPLGSFLELLAVEDVQVTQAQLSVQHQLASDLSLVGLASAQRSETTRTRTRSQQLQLSANVSWQADRYITVAGGVRTARYQLQPTSFGENALFASIQARY